LNTTLLPVDGAKTAAPDARNVFPLEMVRPPLNVARPATSRVLPRVVAPVPTVNVFDPVTEVFPFNEIAPVPVENVPDPT
jgi:hypothetical protein